VDTICLTQLPLDITGAGLLVAVAPRSRWQNDVYTRMHVRDGTWVLSYRITDLFRRDPKFPMTTVTST